MQPTAAESSLMYGRLGAGQMAAHTSIPWSTGLLILLEDLSLPAKLYSLKADRVLREAYGRSSGD